MGIREEFYGSLENDYKLEGERSFLYRYFRDHPQQQRGGAKGGDVRRAIQIFLYDVKKGRKKDRSLAMLDAYCTDRGIDSLLGGGAKTEQTDLEELEAFCNTLMAGENETILIPLKIDPGTGAGLYLMGTDYLNEAELHLDGTCCYACLWMEDLLLEKSDDHRYVWSTCALAREQLEEQCGFPNLTEALNWFQYLTAMDQDAYLFYTLNNGTAPPNCPAALRRYFEAGETQTETDALIAQGRESFARDAANGKS